MRRLPFILLLLITTGIFGSSAASYAGRQDPAGDQVAWAAIWAPVPCDAPNADIVAVDAASDGQFLNLSMEVLDLADPWITCGYRGVDAPTPSQWSCRVIDFHRADWSMTLTAYHCGGDPCWRALHRPSPLVCDGRIDGNVVLWTIPLGEVERGIAHVDSFAQAGLDPAILLIVHDEVRTWLFEY